MIGDLGFSGDDRRVDKVVDLTLQGVFLSNQFGGFTGFSPVWSIFIFSQTS